MTMQDSPFIVVLIAAHNEERSIVTTLQSQRAQLRRPDRIVVAADNCDDRTAELARSVPGVTVYETEGNTTKKPGALNQAWRRYCGEADLVVCIDADTILEPTAVGDWEAEFVANDRLGGCSGKFTMLVDDSMSRSQKLLVRIQRAEFAKWTDLALRRGRKTNVLAGTACCMRNETLREITDWRAETLGRTCDGPWLDTSAVEDFELTYRMRERGWETKVSASVRAYTDAMTDLKSLWAQRMKWQTGTVSDLMDFGVNRLTLFDWRQQVQGLVAIAVRLAWIVLTAAAVALGTLEFHPLWLIPPALFLANDVRQAFRIPNAQPADIVVAALLVPQEVFAFLRAGWFAASWGQELSRRAWGVMYDRLGMDRPGVRDRWNLQARAERDRMSRPIEPARTAA
jgi:cellulose synthase/poly-beta-1,6-N-acetylglucosamine synthase-like glycosyltransferase